nr:hypothetical protein CFP56_21603 [Quercus suber]
MALGASPERSIASFGTSSGAPAECSIIVVKVSHRPLSHPVVRTPQFQLEASRIHAFLPDYFIPPPETSCLSLNTHHSVCCSPFFHRFCFRAAAVDVKQSYFAGRCGR